MRRADRLFQIVQHLRGGRLVTARQLAERLEVSDRTIYRDIADLQSTGVPIDGEAGIGYIMRDGFELPPLMFTRDEIVALVAGAKMVRAWGGASMARAAEEALVKIEAVLPEAGRQAIGKVAIEALQFRPSEGVREAIDLLEDASERRLPVRFSYTDNRQARSERTIDPLGLWFWGGTWTIIGWCHLRDDFRMFRIDRMQRIIAGDKCFKPMPGRTLRDFYRQLEQRGEIPPGWRPDDPMPGRKQC